MLQFEKRDRKETDEFPVKRDKPLVHSILYLYIYVCMFKINLHIHIIASVTSRLTSEYSGDILSLRIRS